jgi:hypothetical protein
MPDNEQLARDAVDQYRRMISECIGPPHFALSREEVDNVAYAMQKVWGSAITQETTAVRRAMTGYNP